MQRPFSIAHWRGPPPPPEPRNRLAALFRSLDREERR